MSDKKGEKKKSVVAEKKASVVAGAAAGAAAALTGEDGETALGLTPEEELAAKEAAIRALPVRQYLEATVVPFLLHGLQLLAIERPENPVDFLARYLIEKNAEKKKKEEEKKQEKKAEVKEE